MALEWHLTGGVSNTDPKLSLGGVTSNTIIVSGASLNLFNYITPEDILEGKISYRSIILKAVGESFISPDIYIGKLSALNYVTTKVAWEGKNVLIPVIIDNEYSEPITTGWETDFVSNNEHLHLSSMDDDDEQKIWIERSVTKTTTPEFVEDSFIIRTVVP